MKAMEDTSSWKEVCAGSPQLSGGMPTLFPKNRRCWKKSFDTVKPDLHSQIRHSKPAPSGFSTRSISRPVLSRQKKREGEIP